MRKACCLYQIEINFGDARKPMGEEGTNGSSYLPDLNTMHVRRVR